MGIYFHFPSGWWVMLGFIYLLWLALFLIRKSYKKPKEIKASLICGIVTVIISFFIEFIAINLSVWTYFPGNWPIVLWLGYFGAGILSYQIVKTTDEQLHK